MTPIETPKQREVVCAQLPEPAGALVDYGLTLLEQIRSEASDPEERAEADTAIEKLTLEIGELSLAVDELRTDVAALCEFLERLGQRLEGLAARK